MGTHKTKAELIDGLDAFTRAYIECALWSSNDESTPEGGEPIDQNYDIDDLTMGALKQMIADCKDFQEAQAADLALRITRSRSHEWSPVNQQTEDSVNGQSGHDFWLTRNGHGAGFWDRGLGDLGRRLTDASKPYGDANLYVYRGKIYHA